MAYIDHARAPYAGAGSCELRQASKPIDLCRGTKVVSADGHLSLGGEDLWFNRAPVHLKDRVPRVWFDEEAGHWDTGFDFKSLYPGDFAVARYKQSQEGRRGSWDVAARVEELSQEGVDAEIAFPQLLGFFFHWPDLEAREFIFRTYNEYLASLQEAHPGKFFGVAIPNFWSPEEAERSIDEICRLGLKTLMLPGVPGKYGADGEPIRYPDEQLSPLWSAIERSGLPVCFHIGEQILAEGRGAIGISVLNNLGGSYFRRIYGDLVFGGVFDRHPTLKVVFAEAGLNWVPGVLQDADMVRQSFDGLLDYEPQLQPSLYWAKHCFATFMHDPAGLALIDRIGASTALWSTDYPHNESTFGYTASVVDEMASQLSNVDVLSRIVGQNAIELFDLDI